MNKYILILLIICILSIGIVGAKWSYEIESSISNVVKIDGDDKFRDIVPVRFHDDRMNVTCWIDGQSGLDTPISINCLPDYMLSRPSNYNPNALNGVDR